MVVAGGKGGEVSGYRWCVRCGFDGAAEDGSAGCTEGLGRNGSGSSSSFTCAWILLERDRLVHAGKEIEEMEMSLTVASP